MTAHKKKKKKNVANHQQLEPADMDVNNVWFNIFNRNWQKLYKEENAQSFLVRSSDC